MTRQQVVTLGVKDANITGSKLAMPLTLNGNIVFSPDNTYDIGASGTSRPRSIYAATSFIGPGAVPPGGDEGQVLTKSAASNYALIWATPSGGGGGLTVPLTENLTFSPDSTYDIGATSTGRPYRVFVGSDMTVADYMKISTDTITGNAGLRLNSAGGNQLSLRTNGTTRWYITTTGHLVAGIDNTYDIGTSGVDRPRDLHVARNININGGLAFNSTAQRITGDFSNATSSNRVLVQTNVANGQSLLGVMPNGTNDAAGFQAFGLQNVDNAPYGILGIDASAAYLGSNKTGTGTVLPLSLRTGGTERLKIETDGRIDVTSHRLRLMSKGTNPTSGQSLEMGFETPANMGFIYAFDWGAVAWRDLDIAARNILIRTNGGTLTLPNSSVTTPMLAANAVQQLIGSYVTTPAWSSTATSTWVATPVATASIACSGAPVRIEFTVPFQHSVANGNYAYGIAVDPPNQTPIIYWWTAGRATANGLQTVTGVAYYTPSVGNHIFAVVIFNSTAGTLTIYGSGYSTLYVTEQKR